MTTVVSPAGAVRLPRRARRGSRLGVLAASLVSVTVLAGCAGADPAAPVDEATGTSESTGTLVVYSGRDEELVSPLIEQFEQTSGVDVDVRYAGTTELAAQLLAEGDASPAHVFLSQDAGALGTLSDAGLFADLPEEVLSQVPAEYSAADGTWVGLTGRARVIAYDSQELTAEQVPGDVFALTDPRWQGQVALAPGNASFQAFVTALRVVEGEERAQQWLEGMVANDVQVFERNGEILDAVDSGTVDLGLINHYYYASSEQDPATLRAQLRFGDPGTTSALVNVTGAGVLTGAAGSADAQALLTFLLSSEGQTYFSQETAEYPLVAGIPSPAGVPTLAELDPPDLDLSDLASLEETVDLLTRTGLL